MRQAVIMAAGLGTRLRPLTLTTPKPLLLVAGRPILEWKIEQLPSHVTEVVLVVNYLQEQIREHFGDEWGGRKITYIEQIELNGTGGAIQACHEVLQGRFIVLNGDDLYTQDDIAEVCKHRYAIAVQQTDITTSFGAITSNEDGTFAGITEGGEPTPGNALVNTGLYALDTPFLKESLVALPGKDGEFGLPQTLAQFAQHTPVTLHTTRVWYPIGYQDDLERASALLEQMHLNKKYEHKESNQSGKENS